MMFLTFLLSRLLKLPFLLQSFKQAAIIDCPDRVLVKEPLFVFAEGVEHLPLRETTQPVVFCIKILGSKEHYTLHLTPYYSQLLKRTYHPLKSLGSLFAFSSSCSSFPVKASGLVWACFLKISSNFSGTNLQVHKYHDGQQLFIAEKAQLGLPFFVAVQIIMRDPYFFNDR